MFESSLAHYGLAAHGGRHTNTVKALVSESGFGASFSLLHDLAKLMMMMMTVVLDSQGIQWSVWWFDTLSSHANTQVAAPCVCPVA